MNTTGNTNSEWPDKAPRIERLLPHEVPIISGRIRAGDLSLHAMYAQTMHLIEKQQAEAAARLAAQQAADAALADVISLDAYRQTRSVAVSRAPQPTGQSAEAETESVPTELVTDAVARAQEAVRAALMPQEGNTDVQEAA